MIALPSVPAQTIYSSTDTPIPILDDAVTTDSIFVPDDQTISSMDVAIAVQHPRISDLVFHLISPDGTRVLLMENRGGTDPNGAGGVATVTTNTALASDFDTVAPGDYAAGQPVGGLDCRRQSSQRSDRPGQCVSGQQQLAGIGQRHAFHHLDHGAGRDLYSDVPVSRAGHCQHVARREQPV